MDWFNKVCTDFLTPNFPISGDKNVFLLYTEDILHMDDLSPIFWEKSKVKGGQSDLLNSTIFSNSFKICNTAKCHILGYSALNSITHNECETVNLKK